MSCKHGIAWHEEDCELCVAESEAWDRGYSAALSRSIGVGKDEAIQFENASRALMEWLDKQPNPHMTAIVTGSGAELLVGQFTASNQAEAQEILPGTLQALDGLRIKP